MKSNKYTIVELLSLLQAAKLRIKGKKHAFTYRYRRKEKKAAQAPS